MSLPRALEDVLSQGASRYKHALLEVFGNVDTPRNFHAPSLGSEFVASDSTLLDSAVQRIICTLSQQYRLLYFPQLPSLADIMLHFLSEPETFCILVCLVATDYIFLCPLVVAMY